MRLLDIELYNIKIVHDIKMDKNEDSMLIHTPKELDIKAMIHSVRR